MPRAAETFALPGWINIRKRTQCDLPAWDSVLVSGRGFKRFTLTEPAAIEPLIRMSGPSMWRGYDDVGNEVGAALPATLWIMLQFKLAGQTQAVISIQRNEHGVFCWWHPHMDIGMDKNGNHKGWHPCAVIEVPRNYIEQWLEAMQR